MPFGGPGCSVVGGNCVGALSNEHVVVVEILSDWVLVIVVALGLLGLLGLGEALRAAGMKAAHTRRLVHSGVAGTAAGLPLLFGRPLPVYGLAMLFVVVNAAAKWGGWWQSIHKVRPNSWGTVTMPLALIVAVAGTWSVTPDRIVALQAAFLVLAVADPLAAWAGQRYGTRRLRSGVTLLGSTSFFVSTALIVGGLLAGAEGWDLGRAADAALLVAGAGTAVEGIGRWGLDNLGIVLAVLLVLVPLHEGMVTAGTLRAAGITGTVFGAAAYGTRVLTGRGAVGGGLFAATLVGGGGVVWVVPALTFFVLSSALSQLPDRASTDGTEQHESRRTLRQVFANGGVAWALLAGVVLAPVSADALQMGGYLGFLGALAAAAADTWATELGTRYAGRPWSLRTLRRAAPGTSGAVSVIGTGGAVAGAVTIVGAAYASGAPPMSAGRAVIVVGAGLVGMMADSLLGATLQARYYDPEANALVERPVKADAVPARGWAGVDNEVVNLCGTTVGAAVAMGGILIG